MSSKMSHSCNTSPLQKGASTLYSPSPTKVAVKPVLERYSITWADYNLAPIKVSAFLCRTLNSFDVISGVKNFSYPLIIWTGSTSNGLPQYSANAQMILFKQTYAFGLFKAVTSTKTFLVLIDIFECSPFIIGGTEQTTSLLSKTKG